MSKGLNEGPEDPSFGVNRRWALVALLLVVVLVIVVTGVALFTRGSGAQPSPSQATSGPTVWQQITSSITADVVPKDAALEAFAYVMGAQIPGVTVPAGVDGGDQPTSASGVVRWVQAHWTELTPDQQAAVSSVIGAHQGDVVVHLDATQPTAGVRFVAAVAHVPTQEQGPPAAPGSQLQSAMSRELVDDIQHIGPKLDISTIDTSFQLFADVSLTFSDQQPGDSLFLTQAVENGVGHYSPCNVTAWRDAWTGESVDSLGNVSNRLHVLMTHEVVHCYQNVIFGNVATALAMPPWITEGTALWLAADDTQIAEPMIPSMWKVGYMNAEQPLTNRSYDAFGWYALYDHLRPNILWSLMKPAWTAAAASGQRSDSFMSVLKGDDDQIRDAWAPSYLRQDAWSDPWIMYGFGLPGDAQVTRHPITAAAEPGYESTLQSRANTVLDVTQVEGEIVGIATNGLASVHDQGAVSALAFKEKRFCVSEKGCICPPGTQLAGQNLAPDAITVPFALALNSPEGGSDFGVAGFKLDDLCGKAATPQPGSPCQTNCGNSNGDPHLRTVNRYKYDFQGAGEFVLLRNQDSSIEIQAREEPYVGSSSRAFRGVAINTAVAARDNGHSVSVYATSSGLVAHVDGETVDATAAVDLGAGAAVKAVASGIEIVFPDGTILWTLSVSPWGINAVVQPSDALRADGIGLLGPITPGGMGVPALPDGTQLPAAPDVETRHTILYGQFADAWRVTDSTTLFDYDAGKSTTTYTDKSFPSGADDSALASAMASPSPDQQQAAQSACAAVTDPDLNSDCQFDVFATGDSGFAQQYTAQQELYDSGIAPATAPPPTQGAVVDAQKVVELQDLGGATIGPDDTLYVSIDVASGAASILAVDPRTAAVKTTVDEPRTTDLHFAAGSLWGAGLAADASGGRCTVSRLDPATLATQATLQIPCAAGFPGPHIVSMGDAIWFVDTSAVDPSTGAGAKLTRIDPDSNTPGQTVDLGYSGGCCQDSNGAVFCYCGQSDVWRLTSSDTMFVDLGNFNNIYPAGQGFWTEQDQSALLVNDPSNTTALPLQVGAHLVGGDSAGIYVQGEQTGQLANNPLLRQSVDGTTPVQIAVAPTYGSGITLTQLDYGPAFPSFSSVDGYLHLWTFKEADGAPLALWLQWAQLP